MNYYYCIKHLNSCKYTFDTYRVKASDKEAAIKKVLDATGVVCDYANQCGGFNDNPLVIDIGRGE